MKLLMLTKKRLGLWQQIILFLQHNGMETKKNMTKKSNQFDE